MQFHQLRYFISLVDRHSFTEAARECFITQSALSQQIKNLEQELEVVLVTRKGRHFSVTPAGMLLYERAVKLTAQVESLAGQVQRVHRNSGSTLRLGLLSSMDCSDLPERLMEQVTNRTGFELSLQYGSHDELYELFGSGALNAFISWESRLNASDSFTKARLFAAKTYVEIPRSIEMPSRPGSKLKVEAVRLGDFKIAMVCDEEHLPDEQYAVSNMLGIDLNSCISVPSVHEGRRIIQQHGRCAMIVDRSLMRGDASTYHKVHRYEIVSEGKAIKRPLCCYARRNLNPEDLNELCTIVMELAQKRATGEDLRPEIISVDSQNQANTAARPDFSRRQFPI